MSGFELVLITDRRISVEPLVRRVGRLAAAGVAAVILREKDLPEPELIALARALAGAVRASGARLIVNSSLAAAEAAGAWGVQLPGALFQAHLGQARLRPFKVGVSVHNLEEAAQAQSLGADWVLAGPVFETTCKPGQPGRGLEFLRQLKSGLNIPLWAVGGLTPARTAPVLSAGAAAVCVRSPLLTNPEPEKTAAAYLEDRSKIF